MESKRKKKFSKQRINSEKRGWNSSTERDEIKNQEKDMSSMTVFYKGW